MDEKPKRRWFRFSLRMLFVLVTVLCVWIGWNANIVRERKSILAEIERTIGPIKIGVLEEAEADHANIKIAQNEFEWARVSRIRRMLSDRTYLSVHVPGPIDARLAERLEIAFPESHLAIRFLGIDASRDSLYKPAGQRQPNHGRIFKTGLIKK